MNGNDAKGCCGVCGVIVILVLVIGILGVVVQALPFLVVAGLIFLVIYLVNKHAKNNGGQSNTGPYGGPSQTGQYGGGAQTGQYGGGAQGGPYGNAQQNNSYGGQAQGGYYRTPGGEPPRPKEPRTPIPEKSSEEIQVTIRDLEATEKAETLKAMLEEDRR